MRRNVLEVELVRTVPVGMLLSLDGVAESPDRFSGWDDALDANTPPYGAPGYPSGDSRGSHWDL